MANYDVEYKRAEQSGDEPVEGGFVGNVRQLGPNSFKVGDMFRIPADFKVFKNAQLSQNTETPVLYTFVELMSSKTKSTGNVRQLYPSMFQRTIYAYKKDEDAEGGATRDREAANGLGYITAGGKVAEDFSQHTTVQEAMQAIAGKTIKIVEERVVNSRNYLSKEQLKEGEMYTITPQKAFVLEYA